MVVLTLAQTGTVSSRIRLLKQRQPGMLHGRAKDVARILKLCAIVLVIDFRFIFFFIIIFPLFLSLSAIKGRPPVWSTTTGSWANSCMISEDSESSAGGYVLKTRPSQAHLYGHNVSKRLAMTFSLSPTRSFSVCACILFPHISASASRFLAGHDQMSSRLRRTWLS